MKILSSGYQVPIPKAAVKHIKDSVQWKQDESGPKLPEGYHPPDISLLSTSPNPKRDIFFDIDGYMKKNAESAGVSGSNETSRNEPRNRYECFLDLTNAYQKIIKESDDDIAYCENLVKNNTDPLQKECFQELLDRAHTRRKNIGEQAAEQLSSYARMISSMDDLDAKFRRIESIQEGNPDDPQVTSEIERLSKAARMFEKIGRLDFKRLLANPNDAAATFEYLFKTMNENFSGFLRD